MFNKSRLRLLGIVWMVLFLLWLPFEDTQISLSAALAGGLSIWLALRVVQRWGWPRPWPQVLVGGALLGAAVPLIAIALMAFKSGLHAHGFADFTLRQIWTTLNFIPVSMVAGVVLAALVNIVLQRKHSLPE